MHSNGHMRTGAPFVAGRGSPISNVIYDLAAQLLVAMMVSRNRLRLRVVCTERRWFIGIAPFHSRPWGEFFELTIDFLLALPATRQQKAVSGFSRRSSDWNSPLVPNAQAVVGMASTNRNRNFVFKNECSCLAHNGCTHKRKPWASACGSNGVRMTFCQHQFSNWNKWCESANICKQIVSRDFPNQRRAGEKKAETTRFECHLTEERKQMGEYSEHFYCMFFGSHCSWMSNSTVDAFRVSAPIARIIKDIWERIYRACVWVRVREQRDVNRQWENNNEKHEEHLARNGSGRAMRPTISRSDKMNDDAHALVQSAFTSAQPTKSCCRSGNATETARQRLEKMNA